jgi:hypothetical protein
VEPGSVLGTAEAQRRAGLLGTLGDALAERSVETVLVRRWSIVLRADMSGGPSGPTNPALHIFAGDGMEVVTTDGTEYRFASTAVHQLGDMHSAAESVPDAAFPGSDQ